MKQENNISYEVAGKASEDVEVNYVSRSGILKEAKLENLMMQMMF